MSEPTHICIRRDDQDETILLESKCLRVLIDPKAGGKIRSFVSKRTGMNFLHVDRRDKHDPDGGYSAHDISGFDECFPTVWPCDYPAGKREGSPMGDHGHLWQRPWVAQIANGCVQMSQTVPQFQSRFQRTCRLDSVQSLRLDYAISNDGDEPLAYLYSAHPLLAAGSDARLILPREITKMFAFFVANVPGLFERTWIDWPPSSGAGLDGPFSGRPGSCVKLYSPALKVGRAAIHHADVGQSLQVEFDVGRLPYLGLLIQQGYATEETPESQREVFLALEPTTGIGDDLPTCETTGTVAQIPPGESVRFWIRLELLEDE
jgi:galactose mutarotase-like enzyme